MVYGRPLEKFTEKRKKSSIQEIAVYFDEEMAKYWLKQASKKAEACEWVLANLDQRKPEERQEIKKNAEIGLRNSQALVMKISSQLI